MSLVIVCLQSISPGAVRTEMTADVPGMDTAELSALLPTDIADAVIFVLSLRQAVHVSNSVSNITEERGLWCDGNFWFMHHSIPL